MTSSLIRIPDRACPWAFGCSRLDHYAINEPDHACIRIIRFVLIGGGQIRVQEMFIDPKFRWELKD
jgi:hypothetical protein